VLDDENNEKENVNLKCHLGKNEMRVMETVENGVTKGIRKMKDW